MDANQIILRILTAIIICSFSCGEQTEDAEDTVFVSPKCAAVIISGGTIGGAGLAYALTPTALCTAGFCPVGVSGSSFASWWQSTMPLVKGGSLFATLQSVAMGGVGTKVVVAGSVLGGRLSGKYLQDLCKYVDDPDSKMAPVFDATLAVVQGANLAADKAKAACSSSESCTAAADLAQAASTTLSSSVASMWIYVSDGLGQTTEAVSNWTETVYLERKVDALKQEIKAMKENTYTGRIMERVGNYSSFCWHLDWLSGGVVERILCLEDELQQKEARLLELKGHKE